MHACQQKELREIQREKPMMGEHVEKYLRNNLEVSKWLFIYGRSRDWLLQGETEEQADRAARG